MFPKVFLILCPDSTTAESLTNQNEAEVQRRCEERQQELSHLHEILETKIQLLQEVQNKHTESMKNLYYCYFLLIVTLCYSI